VSLTEYDGLTWLPGSNYRSAGSVLPGEQRAPKTTEIRQEVTMLGLDGLWLPAVEQPHQVNNVRISYDPTTGSLLTAKGLRPGLRYDVVSERSDFDVGKLTNAPLSNLASIRHYASVPSNLPDEIVNFATSIVAPAVTPYNRALLIEQFLLRNFTFSPDAASGHGLANLNFFLRTAPELGGRRGTSEQFAAAFALLARITGLPTRISVGFHAGTPQGDGRYMVRSGDAFAWPEVYFAGFGWVPFDPSPRQDNSSPIPPDQATPQAQQQNRAKQNQLEELENPEPKPSPGDHSAKGTGEPTGKRVAHVTEIALIALVALLLIATVAVVVARLLLRRRRLGAPLPSDRVFGAWGELIDALRLVRLRPSPDMTAHEVALLAANATPRHPGPLPPVTVVADVANAVSFASQLISPAHADEAVKQTQAYVRQLRHRQKWIRRLLWWVRPG
ncbi:MAG: transglutaminase TgpA family protein, partial [Mycobacteriales bacterium]